MSNLSQGPEVYQYGQDGRQATSIEQRITYHYPNPPITFNSANNPDNRTQYPPAPALNKFG